MKLNKLDDTLLQTIDSSIRSGDASCLLDCFINESSCIEKLDFVYSKLGDDIATFSNNLPEKDDFISNALQILLDLIQAYGISETLCLCLAKTVLLLIIDENCSINNIKRAIHVYNSLLCTASIISTLVNDESLEGSLQILGRKIPCIGDFECQALLFEALYRITCKGNREYWASIWFTDITARAMFLNLDPQKFELNCRKALNYINRNEAERKVFSFLINSVSFGTFQLKKPYGCDYWVDFNYDSQSISFYCAEFCDDESQEDSGMWETILITTSSVKSYSVKDKQGENFKQLILLLNCPCHTLITLSNIAKPAFNSHEVSFSFLGILDIHQHLEKIYGKEKYIDETALSESRKISTLTGVINITAIEDKCMNESSSQNRKVSNLSDSINICNEVSKVWSSISVPKKKVFVSQPISIDAFDDEVDNVTEVSHKTPNKLHESPKGSSNSEANVKTPLKTVRLYNLDNAPVYDVPPFSNASQVPVEKTINKNRSCITEGDIIDNFENTLDNSKSNEKEAEVGSHTNRKRSLNENKNIDKSIPPDKRFKNLFQDSDDDFEPNSNRDNWGRKHFEADIPKYKKNSVQKKKYESLQSSINTAQTKGSARVPRKAAVLATKENRRILDSATEVECDRIEVLDEIDHTFKKTKKVSDKKRRSSKIYASMQTDTETGSSEVSWLKQKKSCSLFETPKKSYSEWKKSRQKKRKLPVKVVPDVKTSLRESSPKRRKKSVRNAQTSDLGTKSNTFAWSDFKNFVLTIEKSKRLSCSVLKDMEYDIQTTSNSSRRKSTQLSSRPDASEQNLNVRNESIQQNGTVNEDDIHLADSELNADCNAIKNLQIDDLMNKHKRVISRESDDFSNTSQNKSAFKNKLNVINHKKATDIEMHKKYSNSSALATSAADDVINQEKRTEVEKVINSDEALASSEIPANDEFVYTSIGLQAERTGKEFILERFLESVAEYSESLKSPTNLSNHGSGSHMNTIPSHLNNNSFANRTESSKYSHKRKPSSPLRRAAPKKKRESIIVCYDENAEKETEYAYNNEINLQDQTREIIGSIRDEIEKPRKSTNYESSSSLSKTKKQKSHPASEDLRESQSCFNKHKHLKKSQSFKKAAIDDLFTRIIPEDVSRNVESSSSLSKTKKQKSHPTSEDLDESQSCFNKHKHLKKSQSCKKATIDDLFTRIIPKEDSRNMDTHDSFDETNKHTLDSTSERFRKMGDQQKKVKGFSDSSFNTLQSTSASFQNVRYDQEWFDKITFALSQNANNLTRKLLATVQKCFCEYSAKVSALRENILKTAESLAIHSGPITEPENLRNLIKSCKITRHEFQKSLKEMYITGHEYFQAEKRFHIKLRQKHIKASKKFILSMQNAEKGAVRKLEQKILLKAKRCLRNFVKHVETA